MSDPSTHPLLAYAKPSQRVRVASKRRLNVHVTGSGSPPILLLNGLGGTNLSWFRVQRALSAETTVVSFDHAGLGFSDLGPLPRSSKAIVEDLRKALQALNLAPPYIVVGQSAGGLNAQYFAYAHPEEVAGLVFVDPSSAYQTLRLFPSGKGRKSHFDRQQKQLRELARLGKAGQLTPHHKLFGQPLWEPNPRLPEAVNDATRAQRTGGANWKTQADELRAFAGLSSEQIVSARRHLGDIPLVVLSAGRMVLDAEGAAPDAIDHWRAMHAEIASHSSRGEVRLVDAGHNMHFEDAEKVIGPLKEVLAEVRPWRP